MRVRVFPNRFRDIDRLLGPFIGLLQVREEWEERRAFVVGATDPCRPA